jgi:hypothetical protein
MLVDNPIFGDSRTANSWSGSYGVCFQAASCSLLGSAACLACVAAVSTVAAVAVAVVVVGVVVAVFVVVVAASLPLLSELLESLGFTPSSLELS